MKTDNTFFLISKIKQLSVSLIEKELKRNDIKGISSSHGDIMHTLRVKKEVTMTDIANIIKRDRSTVTSLVSKLEKNGYVYQRKNELDSRSTLVGLTEKGKEICPDFDSISNTLFEVSKDGISEEDWEIFRSVLIKLYDNLATNKK